MIQSGRLTLELESPTTHKAGGLIGENNAVESGAKHPV